MLPSLKPFLLVKWNHWLLFLYSQSSPSCIINCTYIFLVNINFISSCFVTVCTQNYLIISCFQGKTQKLIVKGPPYPQSPSNLFVKKIHSPIHLSMYPFSKTLWNTCAVLCLVAQLCLTLCAPMDCSLPGSSVHGDSPGNSTGVGGHAFLQGIFPTQGSNPGLPHYRWILYHLSHQESPRILEWVAYPLSRGSSWPRNRTRVSYIAGRFFTTSATREAHWIPNKCQTLSFALITKCNMDRPCPSSHRAYNLVAKWNNKCDHAVWQALWEKAQGAVRKEKRQSGAKGLLPEEVLSRLKSCE